MAVAERLGKTDLELMEQFDPDDLVRWLAYMKICADDEKKAYDKAKKGGPRPGKGGGFRSRR